jgi:hypothetical protein
VLVWKDIMCDYLIRSTFLIMLIGFSACTLQTRTSYAADDPDLIFKRSTVFKWVTPNDKLATYGIDDPEVEGVACHFTVPERGGLTGWIGVAEEVSDISLACRQVGPIPSRGSSRRAMTCFVSAARSSSRRCRSCAGATSSGMYWSTWFIRTS